MLPPLARQPPQVQSALTLRVHRVRFPSLWRAMALEKPWMGQQQVLRAFVPSNRQSKRGPERLERAEPAVLQMESQVLMLPGTYYDTPVQQTPIGSKGRNKNSTRRTWARPSRMLAETNRGNEERAR